MLDIAITLLALRCSTLAVFAALLTGARLLDAQTCDAFGTRPTARILAGVTLTGHSYGPETSAFLSVRPLAKGGAWLTGGIGETADREIAVSSFNLSAQAGLELRLPLGFRLCPALSLLHEQGPERYLGGSVDLRYRNLDAGLGVARAIPIAPRVQLVGVARGRSGRVLQRERASYEGAETFDHEWRYQIFEVLVGVAYSDAVSLRFSAALFESTWSSSIAFYPPIARADGEIGFGVGLAISF